MRKTDSGRVVFGGDGIAPDEKYETPKRHASASPVSRPAGVLLLCARVLRHPRRASRQGLEAERSSDGRLQLLHRNGGESSLLRRSSSAIVRGFRIGCGKSCLSLRSAAKSPTGWVSRTIRKCARRWIRCHLPKRCWIRRTKSSRTRAGRARSRRFEVDLTRPFYFRIQLLVLRQAAGSTVSSVFDQFAGAFGLFARDFHFERKVGKH